MTDASIELADFTRLGLTNVWEEVRRQAERRREQG